MLTGDIKTSEPIPVDTSWTLRRRAWVLGRWLLFVVVLWYLLIGCLFPRLPHCSRPAAINAALAYVRAHAMEVCAGREVFGDIATSAMLQGILNYRSQPNSYLVRTILDELATPRAIIFYPRRHSAYRFGFLYRVLFLDFDQNSYQTFLLTADGRLFDNRAGRYDAANPPPSDVLDRISNPLEWMFNRQVDMVPPCKW